MPSARRPKKKSIQWVVAVALLALLALAALFGHRTPRLYAYVVLQGPESLRLMVIHQQSGNSTEHCRANAERIARAMQAQCEFCRLVEMQCLTRLTTRQSKILSGHALDIPVARVPGGAIAFLSGANALAGQACAESQRLASGKLPLECDPAGPDGLELSIARIGGNSGLGDMPQPKTLLWLFLLAAAVSLVTGYAVLRTEPLHRRFSHDAPMAGARKTHAVPTPRVGGMALAAGLAAGVLAIEAFEWLAPPSAYGLSLLALAAIPAFVGGFAEDVTGKVGALARLMLTFTAGIFASLLVGATLDRLDVPGLDRLLQFSPVFAIVFTAFAVSGIANAINLTDGYNGLAGGYSAIVLAALAFVAFRVGDQVVLAACLLMLGALLSFLVWNYPRGRIFMGDGGAYLLGFWLAEVAVLLIVRNPDVSPWLPLILLAYPVVDTLFSIYRRLLLRGRSAGRADAMHLHQLIYRRLARIGRGSRPAELRLQRNNLIALYICGGSLPFMVAALLLWENTPGLMVLGILYWALYLWLYFRLARWRAPAWLIVGQPPALSDKGSKSWLWPGNSK